ncbi:MAG: tetratricopeptide repeat protein [Candidatus Kapaibacteriales bacterium]
MIKFYSMLLYLANCLILALFLLTFISCSNVRNVRNFNQKKAYKELQNKSVPNGDLNFLTQSCENSVELQQSSSSGGKSDNLHNPSFSSEENEFLSTYISSFQQELESLKREVKSLAEIIFQLRSEPRNSEINSKVITGLEMEDNNENVVEKGKNEKKKLFNNFSNNKALAKNQKKTIGRNFNRKSETKDDKFVNNVQVNEEFIDELEEILKGIKIKQFTENLVKLQNLRNKTNNNYQISIIDYWIGEVYYLTKDYENALSYFRKSIEVNNSPKRDKANLMIAECLSRLGRINEAKKAYQKFIQDYPFSEYISRAKKMIQQL